VTIEYAEPNMAMVVYSSRKVLSMVYFTMVGFKLQIHTNLQSLHDRSYKRVGRVQRGLDGCEKNRSLSSARWLWL